MVEFEVEQAMLKAVEKKLKNMKKQAPNVLKMAVNDTARKTKTLISKQIRIEYIIKAKDINEATTVEFGNKTKPTAMIQYVSPVIPMYKFKGVAGKLGRKKYFNPTLKRMMVGKGGTPAKGKIKKSSSLQKIQISDGKVDLKAFIAEMSSHHVGIFQRQLGMKRGMKGEIKELYGPSIPNMVYGKDGERGVYKVVEQPAKDYLIKRLNHHIERVFAKK